MEKVDNFLKATLKDKKRKNEPKNELSSKEKQKVINERYKEIRREVKKKKLKDIKLDRLTRDRVQRKIMRSTTAELAIKGFNALIDEACGINNKEK